MYKLYTHEQVLSLATMVADGARYVQATQSPNTFHAEDCDTLKRNCFHASVRYIMGSVDIKISLLGRTDGNYKRRLEGGMCASFKGTEQDQKYTTHTLYTLIAELMMEFGWL